MTVRSPNATEKKKLNQFAGLVTRSRGEPQNNGRSKKRPNFRTDENINRNVKTITCPESRTQHRTSVFNYCSSLTTDVKTVFFGMSAKCVTISDPESLSSCDTRVNYRKIS